MNKEMYYTIRYLENLSKIFYDDYNSYMSIGFMMDMMKIRIDTSTGFHWERFYKISPDIHEEIYHTLFKEFREQVIKWSLHIKDGDSNE